MNITELSLRRPVTSVMIFISFVVVGIIAGRLVPLEYFPDISFPGAFVTIPYPGSTPEEVEKNITRPVEEAIATISGLEQMSSNSGENQAGIFVQFAMGSDITMKAMEIREKIDGVRNQLPDDMERVFIQKFSAQDQPMMNLRISSERDLSNAWELLNRNLQQRLERVEGVASVDLYGVDKKQIRIELIPERLEAYRININDLTSTLRQASFSVTAGSIEDGGSRYLVRPHGEINHPDQFAGLIIGADNLRLSDIANITLESPERDYGRHLDMKYAIGLDVFKESGANTVAVADRVLSEISAINELPEMRGIQIYEMNNQASGIISSLTELLKAGGLGGLLSMVILWFFLRQIATTLIVALAVPFSLIVTIGLLYFMGLSLNILSMMGLMLAVGMLVDNAVVITENIHRNQLATGDRVKATLTGVRQVATAVTAGTLTTVIVFLPNIISESSMIAEQLYHVAITIIIALISSLFISLTIIPMLTSRIAPPAPKEKRDLVDRLEGRYGRLLGWLLQRRYTSFIVVAGTFFSVAIPMQLVEVNMFPPEASRELFLHYNIEGHHTLERVEQAVIEVEEYLYENGDRFELESVYSFYTGETAQSTIMLKDGDEAEKDVSLIKKEIEEQLPVMAIGSPSFEYLDQSGGERVQVYVIGETTEVLEELSDEVIRRLKGVEGLADIRTEAESGTEEVQLTVDRARARSFDLTAQQVSSMISSAMRGTNLRTVRDERGEIDVVMAMQDSDRQTIRDLMNLPLQIDDTRNIKLASVADYEIKRSARGIQRQDRRTSVGVTVNLEGITMDEARTGIAEVMDQINYPAGYGWSYGRSFQNDQQAMDEMIVNMLLAMFLIYLVMASLFESILFPSSIISSIFFGVVGVFWFFLMTGTDFSFMAMIGILILMGIVVNNGIVLIDHITQLRNSGMNRIEAIVKGGTDRMRPILMTAGTTVLGLLPLCFGTTQIGGDGPPYFPMARAIVGGLTFSTVITLVMLPAIYLMLDDVKLWAGRVWEKGRG